MSMKNKIETTEECILNMMEDLEHNEGRMKEAEAIFARLVEELLLHDEPFQFESKLFVYNVLKVHFPGNIYLPRNFTLPVNDTELVSFTVTKGSYIS